MKHRRAFWLVALCLWACGATPPSGADMSTLGAIQDIQGSVTVTREDGREIPGRAGLELLPGDTLTTGEDGVVGFAFHSGDRFRLNEDSQVSLDELSSDDGETPPLLRLALGFLWAKVSPHIIGGSREVVYAPTAVCGVRGTEFDVVVAEDSASALAVDEGTVEIEVDGESRLVHEGQGTEVDALERIQPTQRAVPRDQRDWKGFRRKRVLRLIERLPEIAPVIRKRFERGVERYVRFTEDVRESAGSLQALLDELKAARAGNDRKAGRSLLQKIRTERDRFVPKARKFRMAFNRMRVMGRNTHHVTRVYQNNRERYRPEERAVIEPNLKAVAESLRTLRRSSRQTVTEVREVFRELRALRESMGRPGTRRTGPAVPDRPPFSAMG